MGMNRSPFDRPLLDSPWVHGIILLAYAGLFLRRLVHPELVDFDDAWMIMRYAQHLVDGHGYQWNISGGPTFGSTSIAYTFWLAGIKFLLGWLLNDTQIVGFSSLLFLLAATLLLMELTFRFVGKLFNLERPQVYVLMAILLSGRYWMAHGSTGMETSMALVANGLFLWRLVRIGENPNPRNCLAFLGIAYLTYLIRLDHAPFLALTPLIMLPLTYKWPMKRVIFLLAMLGIILALDTWVKWSYFGDFLPLPYYVKKFGYYEAYSAYWTWNTVTFLQWYALLTLPFVLVSIYLWQGNQEQLGVLLGIGIPLIITLGVLTSSVQIMGGEMRFYAPYVPHVVIVMGLLGRYHGEKLTRTFSFGRAIIIAMYLGLVTGVFPSVERIYSVYLDDWSSEGFQLQRQDPQPMPVMGDDLWGIEASIAREIHKLPDTVMVAAGEHGYLGALIPEYDILDFMGLHEPRMKDGAEVVIDLVEQDRPGFIWMPHGDYPVMIRRLEAAPFFKRDYYYFPRMYIFGAAIRKDLVPLMQERGAFPELLNTTPGTPIDQ